MIRSFSISNHTVAFEMSSYALQFIMLFEEYKLNMQQVQDALGLSVELLVLLPLVLSSS